MPVRLRWGGIRNLLSGVTTVAHHNPYETSVFDCDFPVRVLKHFAWAHSLVFSPHLEEQFRNTPAGWPFIIHAAEGTDEGARSEISQLEELGMLAPHTVLVHAIGAEQDDLEIIRQSGTSLVWCPRSNLSTYGKTLSAAALHSGIRIALGTDSAITSGGDLIDEIRTASIDCGMDAASVYRMVTSDAAAVLRLTMGEGSLRDGGVGDVVAVIDEGQTPAEAILNLKPEFVMLGGRFRLLSERMAKGRLRAFAEGMQPIQIASRGQMPHRRGRAIAASSGRAGCRTRPAPCRQVRANRGSVNALIDKLPVLVINPHGFCNCRCAMCDIWKRTKLDEIGPDQFDRQLEDIERLGVEWVVFSGGEPLLHADLFRKAAELRRRRIRVTLLSSGLLLSRHASRIVLNFDDVIVSLDGPRAIHDRIRGITRAFDLMAAGVARLREEQPDFPVTGRSTVQRSNCGHLMETVSGAKSMGLDALSFLAADMHSAAFNRMPLPVIEGLNAIALRPDDLAALDEQIEQLIAGGFCKAYVVESAEKLRRIALHFRCSLGLAEPVAPVCNAPWTSAVVEADGTVRPCFFHPPVGSLNGQRGLAAVLNGPEAVTFRTGLDVAANPICRQCVCSLNWNPARN